MDDRILAGIIVLVLGLFFLILLILQKIQRIIKINKLKYKETNGIVIKSINTSDIEYQRNKNEEYFSKHKNARSIYEFLLKIFPTSMDSDEHKGSVYASVIQYEVNNQKYEIVSEFSADRKEKKNTKYRIKYDPNNPSEAFIINDRGKLITSSLTIILIILGIWLLFA